MSLLPERVFVNGDAHVYLAPVGTAAPTDPAATIGDGATGGGTALIEVGYFTEDSLAFNTDPNFETITAHQDNYPIRRIQTSDEATFEADLQEWSAANFRAVYGGGQITETSPGSGIWKFAPPTLGIGGSGRQEVMAVVQCNDGSRVYCFVIPRAMQVEGVDLDLGKGNAAVLPLRLAVLGSGGADPWYLLTNDNAAWVSATPTATSITPATGPAAGGTPVAITGTNLGAVSSITFGGVEATDVEVATNTTVYATTPPHAAGAVTVVLTHSGGTITKPTFYTYT